MLSKQKENEKNMRRPPQGQTWHDIFQFIWTHGIGNELSKDGEPQLWKTEDLEEAFRTYRYPLSKRAVDDWLSGKRVPGARNTHRLARVICSGNNEFLQEWRDALLRARNIEDARRKDLKKRSQQKTKNAPIAPERGENELKEGSAKSHRQYSLRETLVFCAVSSGLSVLALCSYMFVTNGFEVHNEAVAENIRFCSPAQFDEYNKICLRNMTEFSSGVEMIYVSFGLTNAYEGQPFERIWIRNGKRIFPPKEEFNDAAWTGYTYIQNLEGHDPGHYVLRVKVNDVISSGEFTVGK